MAKPKSDADKVKKLEGLLAIELDRAAKMLKENGKLEAELETTKAKLKNLEKHYKKLSGKNKICCNRDEAMAVHARSSSIGSDDSNGL